LDERIDERGASCYESARSTAESFTERAGYDVDLTFQPMVLHGSASRLSRDTGAVTVVDNRNGIVALSERSDLGQFREITFHRKNAVRYDERRTFSLAQLGFEILHVAVLEAQAFGAG
jgi:hypothetical protein